ncbi:MAG: AAA family ATPase, partial [Clostridia bacterium]|nr:AAA family ATPase [Clostridia bacterium]
MVALVAAVAFWQGETEPVQQLSYPQLWEAIADRQVQTVTLGNSPSVKVALTNGMLATAPNPRYAEFKSDLLMAGVTVEEKAASDISPLLGLIMAAALMAVLLRGRGQGAFAKYAQVAGDQPVPDVTFDQVAGGAEAIQSMRDLVDFLRAPEQFEAYGARVPRGVMLYGPPGTGKTLMARALAGEAKVPFFAVSGSDFVQVYVGVGASRVRTLFQKARKAGRAVVFIDEIDAIGKKRDNGNDEREQTLNALLTEMSGFANGQGVIVLAATNRLDTLDEALLRAGRFDRQIEVALPDVQERLAILKVHGKQLPLDDAVDLSQIAAQTPYFSGARLESLLNEAAILAARRGEGKIENQDVEQALIHTMAGQEKKDRQVLAREKEITCAHEAGHAIATCIRMPHT